MSAVQSQPFMDCPKEPESLISIKSCFYDIIRKIKYIKRIFKVMTMNKQTEDLYLSFHQKLFQFLLKKPAVSYDDSVAWLKAAAESFFSFISLTLRPSSRPQGANGQSGQISRVNDYYIIITIEENSKYIELLCQKNHKVPERLAESIRLFLMHCLKLDALFHEELNKTKIYEKTALLHELMDQEQVLKTMVESLRDVFPFLAYCLFLSYDEDQYISLPAIELDVQSESTDSFALEAYLSGQAKSKNESEVYIPIKGRQGTYGVLKAFGPGAADTAADICIISNAAGKAFENSRLYEQSQNMISNLELINETSHQLNRTKRLPDMMKSLSERLISSFGAEEVGFFYKNHLDEETLLPGSTSFFRRMRPFHISAMLKKRFQRKTGYLSETVLRFLEMTVMLH